jgi:ATP-dependent Clp protease ATP-binding subunit ClpC
MRSTDRYNKVQQEAQLEAKNYSKDQVSTEHLLVGLLNVKESMALRILDGAGINQAQIRIELSRQINRGCKNVPVEEIQFDPRVRRVFNLAMDEVKRLNNNYLGTEHLLLALVREGEGMAGRVLIHLGADLEKLRAEATKIQNG